jgi:hypothetical protein
MIILDHFSMFTWFCLIACWLDGDTAPPLRIQPAKSGKQISVIAVLGAELSSNVPSGKLSQEKGERILHLHRVADGKEGPAIFGAYERRGPELHFTPRYPLEPGSLCRARFGKASVDYRVPLPPPAPPALVERVYPTGDVLPANHLRFYIHFSRPMRGGQDIFDKIEILDAKGNPVNAPWLRDELWDATGQRLILYIHPGRIKWGVLLRMLLGAVLMPDQEYTLVIRPGMLDADGRPLGKEYRKKFRTKAEDRVAIDTRAWKIQSPVAGTIEPLTLQFGKAMDRVSLDRFLSVVDSKGKVLAGSIVCGKNERSWSFQPVSKWGDQEYAVKINPRLEDPTGNTPPRPFDADQNTPPPAAPPLLSLPFRPR